MTEFDPTTFTTLQRAGERKLITDSLFNPVVDALNRGHPTAQHGVPRFFLGQPVAYKLRGWKTPSTLGGAYYWASKLSVGNQIIDATQDARLIAANGFTGYDYNAPPDLIILNPSDIIVFTGHDPDAGSGESIDMTQYRCGHSLGWGPDSESGLPDMDVEGNIGTAYLIGQAIVEGQLYDVAMAQRDDRQFVVKVIGKQMTVDEEEVTLGSYKYAAKMVTRHGRKTSIVATAATGLTLEQFGTLSDEPDCIFYSMDDLNSEMENTLDPSDENFQPLAVGYLADFVGEQKIPAIAGWSITSLECGSEGSGG